MSNQKIETLRRFIKDHSIDAYLIPTADFHQSEYVGEYFKSRHFLSGFNGSAGTMVVTQEDACVWTDGRYFVQAEVQLQGTGCRLQKMGQSGVPTVEAYLADCLPVGGVLGFDGRVIDTDMGLSMSEMLKKKEVTIKYRQDLVGLVWEDRPALSTEPIWILETKYAGVTCDRKIDQLREHLKELRCDVHIITTLDEIAWVLNLRGNDVPCVPVFLSYAVVTEKDFSLFVNEKALSDQVRNYLEEHHITIHSYNEVYDEVAALKDKTILLERKKVNYALYQRIDCSNTIVNQMNPCAAIKVVKNGVEIANMKKAHIKDGIAVTRFMYWLKHTIGKETITEMTAAKRLEEFRRCQEGYLGPSFATIAAYSDNAAMCHYHASEEQHKTLNPRGLFLLDSGGHYYEGTTDITRTFALGSLTDKEKEYFTLVSMSMLKAVDMKFLHGCNGQNLDYVIREAFWQRGLDFNHGTGHGVGYLSGVHERPNGIRWKVVPERQDSAVIEPGMICSDEPGLYFEGEFGVRTENMLLCVPLEENQYGQFLGFEFLTYAPIDLDGIDRSVMDEKDVRRLNQYHEAVYEKLSPYLSEDEAKWLARVTRAV